MKLRIVKPIFGGVAALALATASGVAPAADEYIVGSQVISDTVAAPSTYVGDLGSGETVGDCSSGNCGRVGYGSTGGTSGGGGLLGGGLRGLIHPQGYGGCQNPKYDHSDLFYNFYTQGNCNRANAQMYISPVPVPHFVGHTFNTYQPFYPHEYMYWHQNRYHNHYDNGRGLNRTKATYYAPPLKTALSNIYWNKLRLPR